MSTLHECIQEARRLGLEIRKSDKEGYTALLITRGGVHTYFVHISSLARALGLKTGRTE